MSFQAGIAKPRLNGTYLKEYIVHGFVGSPDYRGALDILWSCILTIVASVYTAIHLNIPAKGTSIWRRTTEKLRWAAVAILSPELVL